MTELVWTKIEKNTICIMTINIDSIPCEFDL